MDFALSPTAIELQHKLIGFMDSHVYPAEPVYRDQMRASGDPHFHPPVIEQLKAEARSQGLWNLFLPHKTQWTDGLSNLDYAPLAEITGRSGDLAPEALNCSAPDTGNMELLTVYGTPEQKDRCPALPSARHSPSRASSRSGSPTAASRSSRPGS